MVPGVKNDIHEQLKSKVEADVRNDVNRSKGDQSFNEKNRSKQTKSMDEGGPAWNDSLGKKQATTPPAMFAARTFQPRNDGVNSTEMNVSQAKAMFESISKSQEMLDNVVTRNSTQRSSPPLEKKKDTDFIKPREPVSRAVVSHYETSTAAGEVANELPNHSRTKSLPVENFEGPRREIRRPGTAPNRRSLGRARPKSAHLPSEEGNSGAQYLPLGYAAVPTNDRICHGRKSIASCHPNAESLYKKEASFRHSSEDLRQNENFAIRSDRKSSTLPANQMREAAKKFHQELMRKDPKFRYSFGQIDSLSRPIHHGSSAGGSSSSSLSSSQDQINTADQARRLSNGPTVFSRACSTTSLDSSPGVQEAPTMPTDDDNTILSRLLREQRTTNSSNLVCIEEEARSPRGKSRAFSEIECSHDAVEADERKGRRTISIQTDFIPQVSKKRESFSKRRFSDQASQPPSSSMQNVTPVETCIDDVDPSFIESSGAHVKPASPTFDQSTSHAKDPSSDSIEELDEINRVGKQNSENVSEEGEEFPVTDIDALPPPPEEFLVASPPEREKPQRVINRKKRDHNFNYGASRNSSCVSTDSNVSTSTMDSGIGVRPYSMSDTSPRHSPTRGPSEFDDDYNQGYDEGFKGSREELLDEDCQTYSPGPTGDPDQGEYKESEMSEESPLKYDSPGSESRHSSTSLSPKIEELDNKKASLIESIQKKIDELKLQEQEIGEEIKLNEDLGKKVRGLVERKANQTEFSKYELFIGELNKIVALLLSLTQRLHRYEQMLQDLDMSEEEDKVKREALVSKIDKLRSQHEEACHLREVNDRRGENVANFLDKYFNEEEFADFQYYVDMKSQLALMQSEIKEKVKLGEERYQALYSTGTF